MEDPESALFKFKGYYFNQLRLNIDNKLIKTLMAHLSAFGTNLYTTENKIISFTGTVWFQQILSLIYFEEHRKRTGSLDTNDQVPFLEPPPRLFATHLPYYLFPTGMKNKTAKIIYMYRNPKDALCSYFYFFKNVVLQLTGSFEEFSEQFLEGKVGGNLWFDHIKGWYEHKSLCNIQFMMYEEMKKDLRGSIVKVCKYLGKELSEEDMDAVVTQAMFENMKTSMEAISLLFLPGTIGDWKNHMTIEQNERFDKIFQRKMKDFPLKFIWDMNED
uniref:Sulfotransferase n=1 Tax=Suricata suricatta TaxID=37032 RepID=A0A673USZ5_SURSU